MIESLDNLDDIPLDDVCGILKGNLDRARELQARGAILHGERDIDINYTSLYRETLEYFHKLPLQQKMAILELFVQQYGKR